MIDKVIGMKIKAFAQPNTMMPVHILKKTMKK